MAATLDVWDIPPESAKRVGHPAPFPTELPERLIHLYTYENDLVLDPFMGSGTSLLAAAKLGRRYVGYDLDPAYVGHRPGPGRHRHGRDPTDRDGAPAGVHRSPASPSAAMPHRPTRATTSRPGPPVKARWPRRSPRAVLERAGFQVVGPATSRPEAWA